MLVTKVRGPKGREYAFLAYAVAAATLYGVAHDHVTATISPEYFLLGKGLEFDARPFRWAVSLLAVRASWAPGLLFGAALLTANNPRRSGRPPQLRYHALVTLSSIPLGCAAVVALACGLGNAKAQIGASTALALGVAPDRVRSFVVVWAIHAGSYAGALLGTIASAIVAIERRWRMLTR